jgi:hypothetical protein
MALITKRIDLRRLTKESVGLILLAQFLETGFLRIDLETTDADWLRKVWGGADPLDSLHQNFFAAALNNGYQTKWDGWKWTVNEASATFKVWDPKRIEYPDTVESK